jgi:hypothetical protein
MKSWKYIVDALLVFAGFCAGVGLNFNSVHSAPGDPNPALKSVAHNATLAGDGTMTAPLAIANAGVGTAQLANGGVSAPKLSTSATPSPGQVLGFNGANLAWQNAPVGGGVRVVDSLGNVVGPAIGPGSALRQVGAFLFAISVGKNSFLNNSLLFEHTSVDCSGPRYIPDDGNTMARRSQNNSTKLYYASDPLQQITIHSYESVIAGADPDQPGQCNGPATPSTAFYGSVTTVDLSTLNLTPPFHLEF